MDMYSVFEEFYLFSNFYTLKPLVVSMVSILGLVIFSSSLYLYLDQLINLGYRWLLKGQYHLLNDMQSGLSRGYSKFIFILYMFIVLLNICGLLPFSYALTSQLGVTLFLGRGEVYYRKFIFILSTFIILLYEYLRIPYYYDYMIDLVAISSLMEGIIFGSLLTSFEKKMDWKMDCERDDHITSWFMTKLFYRDMDYADLYKPYTVLLLGFRRGWKILIKEIYYANGPWLLGLYIEVYDENGVFVGWSAGRLENILYFCLKNLSLDVYNMIIYALLNGISNFYEEEYSNPTSKYNIDPKSGECVREMHENRRRLTMLYIDHSIHFNIDILRKYEYD